MSIPSKSSKLWRDLFVSASNNCNGMFNGRLNGSGSSDFGGLLFTQCRDFTSHYLNSCQGHTHISSSSIQRRITTTTKKHLKNTLNSEASDLGDNASDSSKTIFNPYTVYVANINRKLDIKAFQELFSQYGNVLNAKVFFEYKDEKPRVYGFVTFSSQTEVESAVAALHRKEFNGRSLVVREADALKQP